MMFLFGKTAIYRIGICLAGMVILLFGLILPAAAFNEYTGPDSITSVATAQDMAKLHQLIKEYQDKRVEIDREIFDLQENMAWLGMKIKTMEDAHRPVPESMETSMMVKRSRINALSKEKTRYEDRYRNLTALADAYLKTSMPEAERNGPEIDADHETDKNKKEAFQRKLQKKIIAAGLGDWVEFVDDGGCCCRLETQLPILFPSGKAEIAAEYNPFFKSLAELVKAYDVRIFVGGFADIDRIHTKKYASNFELGALRAANVVHELVKHGVKPSVFEVGSTGRYRFKAKGMSTKKSLERRVDLTVVFTG